MHRRRRDRHEVLAQDVAGHLLTGSIGSDAHLRPRGEVLKVELEIVGFSQMV